MSKWKVLDREYIIRRPWLTARRDKVELPDGRINEEYYVLEYPDWVNVIALTPEGMMVMVRQYRYALQIISTEVCAGVIEKGESPLQAAKRELREETGYTGGEWRQLMTRWQNPSRQRQRTISLPKAIGAEADSRNLFPSKPIKTARKAAPSHQRSK